MLAPSPTKFAECSRAPTQFIATAFQPIVDVIDRLVYAHEALVRGADGESAATVFRQVSDEDLGRFDQSCRIAAIKEAGLLGLDTRLHLNFLPNSLRDPQRVVGAIVLAAQDAGIPISTITFEIVEGAKIDDIPAVAAAFTYFRSLGFLTALDDFGEGSSSLNLLADIHPDIVKLDLRLVHGMVTDPVRETIVGGIADICRSLGTTLIAEGIETAEESALLLKHGISLQQGYYFARPAFRSLATPRQTPERVPIHCPRQFSPPANFLNS